MASERLKAIWAGFEARTSRALTNHAIDHIVTPARTDWKAEHQGLLPHGFAAPSAAAFQALRARIVEKGRKAERRAGRPGRAAAAESDTALPEVAYAPESEAARDLVRAVRATEFRTRRPKFDYADAAAAPKAKGRATKPRAEAKGAGAPRRKFLGLF